MNWNIESCIIFETAVGSQMYGTSTSDSDKDFRGVCIPPWEIQNSLLQNFDQQDGWDGKFEDRVIYSLKKFLTLCKDANPAIIELLFSPEKLWVTCHKEWIDILECTNYFISKKAKYTFTGYAHAQLQKIKTHRNWLLNPPKEEPTRERFKLPKNPRVSSEQINAVISIPSEFLIPEYREEAEREKHYREARRYWDMYTNWKKQRNPARAVLEEKWGYDTKHAMHLVRLMHEGEELLLTGKITFPRPDRDELILIRSGLYTYDQLMEKVEGYDARFEELYEKSTLPHSPDFVAINNLYLKLIEEE
jgi:predicted nucleotidyltransferase